MNNLFPEVNRGCKPVKPIKKWQKIWRSALAISVISVLVACGGGGGETVLQPDASATSSGTGTINPNTKLMKAEQATGSILTEDTFTVQKPQSNIYAVGDVIVVDAHGGRLIKIQSVTESANTISYGYTSASLAQAFENLDVAFSGELTSNDLGADFVTNDPELEIAWANKVPMQAGVIGGPAAAISTNTLEIKFKKMGAQVGSGIEIDGNTSFVLNPDFSLKLSKKNPEDTLPTLEMGSTISPALKTSISIASLYGGKVSYTLDKSIDLKPFKRIITVPVLGVPVPVPFWIKPVITISGGVEGTAGGKFTTTYNYGVSGRFGFARTTATGLDSISELSNTSDINATDIDTELGVNLTVPKFEIQFLIYSLAGPNFDVGIESGLVGKGAKEGTPPVEGVKVDGSSKLKANVGIKGGLEFKKINAVKALLGDVSFSYSPVSINVLDVTLFNKSWFFPYSGVAAITVRDNGNAPDDIFEVALDGTAIGRTNKGGSGQFRLKNMRPGSHVVKLTTVEDDSPPGTYEISLAEGLLFESGGTVKSGYANLGTSAQFNIVVPTPSLP